jgi:hypothetical protein
MDTDLITWKRKVLRKISRPTYQLENKNESRNLYQFKSPDNVTVIKMRRLEWLQSRSYWKANKEEGEKKSLD